MASAPGARLEGKKGGKEGTEGICACAANRGRLKLATAPGVRPVGKKRGKEGSEDVWARAAKEGSLAIEFDGGAAGHGPGRGQKEGEGKGCGWVGAAGGAMLAARGCEGRRGAGSSCAWRTRASLKTRGSSSQAWCFARAVTMGRTRFVGSF